MRSSIRAAVALASAALLIAPSSAQTYTNCNPTTSSSCPADSALGRTVSIDLSSESDSFTAQGSPTYGSDGVSFTVSASGDAPQLTSKWYIMFGKVDVVMKAAPGKGIVSSFVLQSDDLDEIDWEWLGAESEQAQSNYFGKGQTTTYNRGAFHADSGSQTSFKTYSIEWTSTMIVWSIDGTTVRTLEATNADNQYPQTPMQIKFGAWSGGDPANAAGTIAWAEGPTDYTQGPFTMQVKSLNVQDYSTGTEYTYGDQSGDWTSIQSTGGTINNGGSPVVSDTPTITATATGQPAGYPWVAKPTTLSATASITYANYPGLPSGWTVSSSGKVVPPSAAPSTSQPASFTPSSAALPSVSSAVSDRQLITTYDQQGFTTVITVAAYASALPTSYDSKGFLATSASSQASSTKSAQATNLENNAAKSSILPVPIVSSAFRLLANLGLVMLAACVGALSIL